MQEHTYVQCSDYCTVVHTVFDISIIVSRMIEHNQSQSLFYIMFGFWALYQLRAAQPVLDYRYAKCMI